MAAVFVPASSTALVGVDPHDAGVASALLNTTQQVGGSLGTALLNTLYAGGGHVLPGRPRRAGAAGGSGGGADPRLPGGVLLGRGALALALVVAVVLINAKKDDIPADARPRPPRLSPDGAPPDQPPGW